MRNVKAVASLCGISVRTLHYYDEIGILKPETSENGYRVYSDDDLEKLMQILFFRELEIPLSKIKAILSNPDFNKAEVLLKHKEILQKKQERLRNLIRSIDEIVEKGFDQTMLKDFDMREIENAKKKYGEEAKERWGGTDAYHESQKRTSAYTKEEWTKITAEANTIFAEFAGSIDKAPQSDEVQGLVKKWQDHISKYYYQCTNDILADLGQMYVADERFTENINQYGEGAAQLMSEAIAIYCK